VSERKAEQRRAKCASYGTVTLKPGTVVVYIDLREQRSRLSRPHVIKGYVLFGTTRLILFPVVVRAAGTSHSSTLVSSLGGNHCALRLHNDRALASVLHFQLVCLVNGQYRLSCRVRLTFACGEAPPRV
jgi:hypothetical protein